MDKPSTTTVPPHRRKGRPRTFDRAAALTRALKVFWRRGYEPASIAELCSAMEINPPSLYAAFGNKAQLFMEAVQHYEDVYWEAAWARMTEVPDIHAAMSGFFKDAGRILTSQDAPCGCLVILAATNVSAEGQDVNDALRALRTEGRDLFLARLRRAVDDKQLPSKTDVDALASALNTMLEGMSLQARDGVTPDELDRVAVVAMTMLPSTQKSDRAHRPNAGRSRSVRQRKSTPSRRTKRYG